MSAARTVALLGAAAGGIVLFVLGLRMLPERARPLPVLSTVPEFSLISSKGEKVTRDVLLGHPWIVDLIFTSCAGICPRMTSEMARLEEASRDLPDTRFLSITVDPERDTPETLAAYAEKAGARRDRWLFLTGEPAEIRRLAQRGFLLPTAQGDPERGEEAVLHSSRFVLVDRQGRVRGSYDSRDPQALLRLRGDLRRVNDDPSS